MMNPMPEHPENDDDITTENERLLADFLRGEDTPPIAGDLPADHRSGFVAVVGRPNVGKSTLMNAFLGEKLAIVSPKPQTTRTNQLGILTRPDAQVIFVDTPGLHHARNKLGEFMVAEATSTLGDADVILFLIDVSEQPTDADEMIGAMLRDQSGTPIILAMNKADLLPVGESQWRTGAYHALLPDAQAILFSATTGEQRDTLLNLIVDALPRGPRYYPADQLTDTELRDNAADLIREQALLQFEQEVPHSVAVQVEQFKERSGGVTYIAATIYVERDSQKRILIGAKGSALKALGQSARQELERVLGTRVYLDLWVKVMKNWRKDQKALRRLGYRNRS